MKLPDKDEKQALKIARDYFERESDKSKRFDERMKLSGVANIIGKILRKR